MRANERTVAAMLVVFAAAAALAACSQPTTAAKERVDTTLPEAEAASVEASPMAPIEAQPQAAIATEDGALPLGADGASANAGSAPDDPPEDTSPPGLITSPVWARRPTGEDIARYYPDRAMRMDVEGDVTLLCRVMATGALDNCTADVEEPEDFGFGDAALRTSRLFRMQPRTADGSPTAGGTVRIPLHFRLPNGG